MDNDPLIRVITGQTPRWFIFSSFFAAHYDRLEKMYKSVEICDPDLEDKLSKDQFKQLCDKFPYLKPASALPPEPKPFVEDVPVKVDPEIVVSETGELDFTDMTVPQLKEYLKDNNIPFDGRKRKLEYFIELAQTT